MNAQIKHTIWDKDNVLFDSEGLAMQIMDDEGFNLVATYDASPEIEKGVPLERGYIYKEYPGTSTDKIVEALIEKFSLPIEEIKTDYGLGDIANDKVAGAIADIITEKTIAGFKQGLQAIPGITKTLEEIDSKLGTKNRAGCTTSPAERMHVSLEYATDPETGENAELAELFNNRAYSGYHVDNKYEYFFADVQPDWKPEECVIIEDSKSGVTKAKAAAPSCHVIGTVASTYYEDKRAQAAILKDAGADIVVSDVRDIPAAIEWINNGLDMDAVPNFKAPVWYTSPTAAELEVAGQAPKERTFH